MKRESKIAKSAEISVNMHATETDEKILRALENLLPKELIHRVSWNRLAVQGHYGNPITVFKTTISGDEADAFVRHLLDSMDKSSIKYLYSTIDERIDPYGNLHIRLHKQYLYIGRILLWDGDDVVKVIIKLSIDREELSCFIRERLGEV